MSNTECLLWADCLFVFMNVCHFKYLERIEQMRMLRLAKSVFFKWQGCPVLYGRYLSTIKLLQAA